MCSEVMLKQTHCGREMSITLNNIMDASKIGSSCLGWRSQKWWKRYRLCYSLDRPCFPGLDVWKLFALDLTRCEWLWRCITFVRLNKQMSADKEEHGMWILRLGIKRYSMALERTVWNKYTVLPLIHGTSSTSSGKHISALETSWTDCKNHVFIHWVPFGLFSLPWRPIKATLEFRWRWTAVNEGKCF